MDPKCTMTILACPVQRRAADRKIRRLVRVKIIFSQRRSFFIRKYQWQNDLDESIWPTKWPDRESSYGKMNALYENNETSKKQLEYIHISLFHNKMIQKGCSYPKAVSSKKTLNTGTNILGINQTLQTALFFSGILRKQKNDVFSKSSLQFWNRS